MFVARAACDRRLGIQSPGLAYVLLENLAGLAFASMGRKKILLLTTNALCWLADAPKMEAFSAVVVAGSSYL